MTQDKRRYIVIQTGASTLAHKSESVDLLMDTRSDIGPCATEIIAGIHDIIVNSDGDVLISCYKHGITPGAVGAITRNSTNSLEWENILEFSVDDDHEREEELALMEEGLSSGGITHVYVSVGDLTPVCFAIMQVGS